MLTSALRVVVLLAMLGSSLCAGRWVGFAVTSQPPRFARLESFIAPTVVPGSALDGSDKAFESTGRTRPLLVFVLSTDCRFCRDNMDFWAQLAASVRSASAVEIVVLSTSSPDETAALLSAHGLALPTHLIGESGLNLLGLPGVPATLVIEPGTRRVDGILGLLEPEAVEIVWRWMSRHQTSPPTISSRAGIE